jgi:hypothetical protein
MAAASRRSRAATWKTWPLEAEKLQAASLTGSTSGKAGEDVSPVIEGQIAAKSS